VGNDVVQYDDLTPGQLENLARAIVKQEVFLDRYVSKEHVHLIPIIFRPIYTESATLKPLFEKDPPGMLYAWHSQALPAKALDYPIFESLYLLTRGQAEIVNNILSNWANSPGGLTLGGAGMSMMGHVGPPPEANK
jgi:hypothetical protein